MRIRYALTINNTCILVNGQLRYKLLKNRFISLSFEGKKEWKSMRNQILKITSIQKSDKNNRSIIIELSKIKKIHICPILK